MPIELLCAFVLCLFFFFGGLHGRMVAVLVFVGYFAVDWAYVGRALGYVIIGSALAGVVGAGLYFFLQGGGGGADGRSGRDDMPPSPTGGRGGPNFYGGNTESVSPRPTSSMKAYAWSLSNRLGIAPPDFSDYDAVKDFLDEHAKGAEVGARETVILMDGPATERMVAYAMDLARRFRVPPPNRNSFYDTKRFIEKYSRRMNTARRGR